MKFEIDVLIIFADGDNESSKNQNGWVSQFKHFLELMLNQVLGEKPNLIMKAAYDTVTSPNLDNAAVLVPVLSKDFIQSGRCLDNVEAFYKSIEQSGKTRNRVFKVFKSPITVMEQPPRLRELIGYDMYQLDPESGEIREYTDYFSSEAERQYWMKMVDLAYDIYDTLMYLSDGAARHDTKSMYRRKIIYLAETGHDMSVQRNIIKRELQRHGYVVLPNQTLPGRVAELEQAIRRDLDESNLSIHLMGAAYGEIPEGSDQSIVDLQNKMAAEKSLKAKGGNQEFSRLIWISPNLNSASEKQKAFIENIKRDLEAQEGAEILQTPLEDFKNIMREELLDGDEKRTTSDTGERMLYLVHDRVDHQMIKPIADMISSSGFKVIMPEFEGELLELRRQHIEHLKNFDAAIIYKGKVNEQWVRMKVLDLLKAPGFGRKKPIIGKAIMTAPGATLDTSNYKAQNIYVIDGDQQRSMDTLKTYLSEINTGS